MKLKIILIIIMWIIFFYTRHKAKKLYKKIGVKNKKELLEKNERNKEIKRKSDYVLDMYELVCKKCQYGFKLSSLNEKEKILYITQTFEMEVNNGGLFQFFVNSSGNVSNDIVNAFLEIGSKNVADICQEVLNVVGRKIPKNREKRIDLLAKIENDEMHKKLSECEMKFFNCGDDLTLLNYEYIVKNKEYFN